MSDSSVKPKIESAKNKKHAKRNKKPKAPAQKARKVAQNEGQRGIDSRVASASVSPPVTQLALGAVDRTIDVVVDRGDRTIEHLALGIVLASIKRGWVGNLKSDETGYVYCAYVYLVQSFYSAMASVVPKLQSAPLWYWNIIQALMPTTASFKTSEVTYKWNLQEGIANAVPPFLEYLNAAAVSLAVADVGLPKVNGFFQLGSPVYQEDQGVLAIKSLFEYWSNTGFNRIVPYQETRMINDTSAFSVVYPELGYASGEPGGMATTIYSERNIHYPLLAKFAQYQDSNYRGWTTVMRSGGGACYVLPRMTELKSTRDLLNRIPPSFKYYDFDEFFEVLALTVGEALERQAKSNVGQPSGPCPLSPQQVQILLRQTMLPMFANELAMDLDQESSNSLYITPFSVGNNGVSITAQQNPMLLPTLLAENIRACKRKVIRLGSGELDLISVLGRCSSRSQLGNYSWSGGLIFTDQPSEVPIDIVNASYTDGNTIKYLDLNGLAIETMSADWNEWIKSLGTFLTPLTPPAQAMGPAILSTLTLTRQVLLTNAESTNNTVAGKKMVKQQSKKDLGLVVRNRRNLGQVEPVPVANNSFRQWGISSVTSTNQPLTPVWKYHRIMVLPVYYSYYSEYGGAIQFRQVFQVEPFKISGNNIPDQSSVSLPDLFELHKQMALMDVRTELSPASELQEDFKALNAMGEGGFFTSLAGAFAEDVIGLKGVRDIANVVGTFIDI